MIELLQGFPDDVLAVKASGRVSKSDYEGILIPKAKAILESHPKVRVYYEIGPECEGFDSGAMWDDFTFGILNLTHFSRVAVVTNLEWIRHMGSFFGFLMPGDVKFFVIGDQADAKEWVVG